MAAKQCYVVRWKDFVNIEDTTPQIYNLEMTNK